MAGMTRNFSCDSKRKALPQEVTTWKTRTTADVGPACRCHRPDTYILFGTGNSMVDVMGGTLAVILS